MDSIRMAVIGAGGIARGHGKRLRAIDGVEIVALAEPSEAMVKAYGEAVFPDTGLPAVYADYRELLDKETLDAVLIASPHTCHYDQIMDSLDQGLHILAEKPLVCSVKHCEQVIEKARSLQKHIVVGYQRRFDRKYRFMKQFIHTPDFGKILCVIAFQSQSWWTSQVGKWRQQMDLSGGGQLNDSGSHLVDMLLWMLDEPVAEVSAMIDNREREVDIDSAVSYRTVSGALGTLSVMGSAPHRGMQEDITINGAGGQAIFLRKGQVEVCRAWKEALEEVTDFGDAKEDNKNEHFIKVLRGEAENESTPESFLHVIRFTEACWQSAAKGGEAIHIQGAAVAP